MATSCASFAVNPIASGKAAGSGSARRSHAKVLGAKFGAIRGGVIGLPKRRSVTRSSHGGNGNFGGNGGGSGGNGGWNNWGGDSFGGDMGGNGSGLALAAVAYPAYDISAKLDMNKVFIFIADILLPFLGVYLYFRKTNKYVWTSLVLTFLPPLGIIFALMVTFGGFKF